MNPLSTFKYIKNNLNKTLPILISMLVGVLLIYLFSLITKSSSEMVDITTNNLLNKYTTIYSTNEESIPQNLLDKINTDIIWSKIEHRIHLSVFYALPLGI